MRQIRGSRPTWMWVVQGSWTLALLGIARLMDSKRIEFGGSVYIVMIAMVAPAIALSWYAERITKRSFVESLPRPDLLTPPR